MFPNGADFPLYLEVELTFRKQTGGDKICGQTTPVMDRRYQRVDRNVDDGLHQSSKKQTRMEYHSTSTSRARVAKMTIKRKYKYTDKMVI